VGYESSVWATYDGTNLTPRRWDQPSVEY